MTTQPSQSGLVGRPVPPLVVSCALSGSPEMRSAQIAVARLLRQATEDVRNLLRSEGELLVDGWQFGRTTLDGRQRWFRFGEYEVDEVEWDRTLGGLGSAYDTVTFGPSVTWGQLVVGAPSMVLMGSWSVTQFLTVATDAQAKFAAEKLRDAVLIGVGETGVGSAFIHVDSVADPYSGFISPPHRDKATTFDDLVHGYYWSVVLGPGHIAQLGGVERVTSQAPCEVVRPLEVGRSEGLLCQLTTDPADLDEGRVRSWRDFLLPVLRFGYPDSRDTFDHLARVGRPMWLFEGEPAPRATGVALQKRSVSPSLRVVWPDEAPDAEPTSDDEPTIWVYCVEGFDPDALLGPTRGVVQAWRLCGMSGRLSEVAGLLRRCTDVTFDVDGDGTEALAFQVDFGTIDVVAAVERLAAGLERIVSSDRSPTIDRIEVR